VKLKIKKSCYIKKKMSKQDLSDKLVGPKNECPPELTKLIIKQTVQTKI